MKDQPQQSCRGNGCDSAKTSVVPTWRASPQRRSDPAALESQSDGRVVQVPVLAELIGRGDGTYILRPKLPDRDLDTWITVKQAAQILGNLNPKSLYSLLGEYLVYRRPLPNKVVVSLRSVVAFKEATQDTEFWDNPVLRSRIKEQVKSTMEQLVERAYGEAAPISKIQRAKRPEC